jgi:hypothetical protein
MSKEGSEEYCQNCFRFNDFSQFGKPHSQKVFTLFGSLSAEDHQLIAV